MIKQNQIITLAFSLLSYIGFSQVSKKSLQTKFSDEKISIDGKLNEEIWKNAAVATDFIMISPDNGKPELKERKSEIKVVYNNDAIYIAATLFDNEPTKIRKELTTRDNFATADHFGVFLNGYNDGQQEFRFFVSAAGVQADVLYTDSNGEDSSWNAIWDSHTEITDFGWTVEMKIPYAALRFSSENKQTWGLNFYREIMRDRQQFTWNLIDNKIGSEANQAGILEGIENIKTPTRLFLIPYSSFYLNSNEAQTKGELKGGLDIKYGINDAFTLDAILVPDFGQTAFDKVELNLGPFEQQFSENRPFFTEGTELFSKGNLVYSRRIGGSPSTYPETNSDEEVVKYPSNVNLLNALKISGRTKSGLGIGFLNAVTKKTFADIKNTTTGETRQEVVEPLANFNVFVLDQRFRKNSSVSFINTNVTRNGYFRDANVSALVFDLNTKKNTYNMNGDFKYSYINEYKTFEDRKGINTSYNLQETSGNYRYGLGGQYVSKYFDNNDLGINFQAHYHALYGNASYRILKPTKTFNSFSLYTNLYSEFDNRTGRIQAANINVNINSTNKKNDYYGFGFNIRPLEIYDFYEPRTFDEKKFLKVPEFVNFFANISSNYNRKFAVDFNPSFAFINEKDRVNYGFSLSPRYRFSNKFSLVYDFNFFRQNNNVGYFADDTTTNKIIMTRRNRVTYTNTISGKYSLNNVMNLNLSVRHYWSYAVNNQFLTLKDDGSVTDNLTFNANGNRTLNTWNMDLSYSWWFAPGSQISILYRNNSYINLKNLDNSFSRDINNSFKSSINHENINHIFSISIRYFIDYNSLKH
ncbi:MAG: carbohydrate binding family 9 domain-containing protein [Flavobacteriaceae bacterium]|nr:carbohydrate binding family 9 domain-containing protein [Flavobacteriaceae bacterium]